MQVQEALQRFFLSRPWGVKKSVLKVQGYINRWSRRWGSRELGMLVALDVLELERERDDGKRSGSALNYERALLLRFSSFCKKLSLPLQDGLIDGWRMRDEEVDQERYVFFTSEERRLLRESIRTDLKRFLSFAAVTGLRESTIRRVCWGWISKEGILRVPATAVKNRVAIRQALPMELVQLLGVRGKADELVFSEMPEHPQTVWKEFKKACRRAGVPEGSPHDLRRSFAQSLMCENTPLLVIAHLGGWKKLETIRRYYCTGLPDKECRKVLEKLM